MDILFHVTPTAPTVNLFFLYRTNVAPIEMHGEKKSRSIIANLFYTNKFLQYLSYMSGVGFEPGTIVQSNLNLECCLISPLSVQGWFSILKIVH